MAKKEKVTLQELIIQTPELKSSLLKFENVKLQLDKAAETCLQIKVTDENSLAVCENNLGKMSDLVSAVEKMHSEGKKPHWDKCKAYDNAKNYVLGFEVDPIEYLKNEKIKWIKLTNDYLTFVNWCDNNYNSLETLEQIDEFLSKLNKPLTPNKWMGYETRVIAQIQKFKDLTEAKKLEIIYLEKASPDETDAIKEIVEESKKEIQSIDTELVVTTTFKKTRNPWTYEIIDINLVPKEFLMIDESKVKAYLKANSDSLEDGKVINGIKYYRDLKVTV